MWIISVVIFYFILLLINLFILNQPHNWIFKTRHIPKCSSPASRGIGSQQAEQSLLAAGLDGAVLLPVSVRSLGDDELSK